MGMPMAAPTMVETVQMVPTATPTMVETAVPMMQPMMMESAVPMMQTVAPAVFSAMPATQMGAPAASAMPMMGNAMAAQAFPATAMQGIGVSGTRGVLSDGVEACGQSSTACCQARRQSSSHSQYADKVSQRRVAKGK